jgi:hypothetical protein
MGQVTYNEERLVVREFPFIFMEIILVLLSCICLGIWFLSPQNLCPRESDSTGGLVTILARSPLMMSLFRGTLTTSLQKLEAANNGIFYRTTTGAGEGGASFTIVSSGEIETNQLLPKDEASNHSKWRRPIIVRITSKVGLVIFTLGLRSSQPVFRLSQWDHGSSNRRIR